MRRMQWAVGFGLAALVVAALGGAILAAWHGETGAAAAVRALTEARVLVWVGFATAAGFVLGGRDRLTVEVERLFEEDRRAWSRRVLHDSGGSGPARSPRRVRRGFPPRPGPIGGVLLGAALGAALGAIVGEVGPGSALGVVAGLLTGLALDRGEG